jgi:hypothetical protein
MGTGSLSKSGVSVSCVFPPESRAHLLRNRQRAIPPRVAETLRTRHLMAGRCGELVERAALGLGGCAIDLGSALMHASCCVSTPFSANSFSAGEWLALLTAPIEPRQPLRCVGGERNCEEYEGSEFSADCLVSCASKRRRKEACINGDGGGKYV